MPEIARGCSDTFRWDEMKQGAKRAPSWVSPLWKSSFLVNTASPARGEALSLDSEEEWEVMTGYRAPTRQVSCLCKVALNVGNLWYSETPGHVTGTSCHFQKTAWHCWAEKPEQAGMPRMVKSRLGLPIRQASTPYRDQTEFFGTLQFMKSLRGHGGIHVHPSSLTEGSGQECMPSFQKKQPQHQPA